jgi:hypothetical protein
MVGWQMIEKLERILVLSVYGKINALFWNLLDRLGKTMKNLIQYSQHNRWDTNQNLKHLSLAH